MQNKRFVFNSNWAQELWTTKSNPKKQQKKKHKQTKQTNGKWNNKIFTRTYESLFCSKWRSKWKKKFERNFFFLLVYEDRTVSCLSVCFVQNMCVNYGPSIVSCFLKSRFLIINVPFWQHTHAHAHKHVRKYVSFDIYSDCTFTLIYVYMHTRTLTSILVQT